MTIEHWQSRLYVAYGRGPDHPMKVRMQRWMRRALGLDQIEVESPYGVRYLVSYGDYVQMEILGSGAYEQHTLQLVRRVLSAGDIMVDVGAHVGQFGLHASPIVGASGRVICFEPNPRTYALLRANVALNGFTNVTALPCAVTNALAAVPMTFGDINNSGASRRVARENGARVDFTAIGVPLGPMLQQLGVGAVAVLKIDVEGLESEVVRSLDLARFRPRHIVFEYVAENAASQGFTLESLVDELRVAGYALKQVDGSAVSRLDELLECNVWASLAG